MRRGEIVGVRKFASLVGWNCTREIVTIYGWRVSKWAVGGLLLFAYNGILLWSLVLSSFRKSVSLEETENGSNCTMRLFWERTFSHDVTAGVEKWATVEKCTRQPPKGMWPVGSFKFLTSDYRKIVHSGKAVCKLIARKQNVGSTAKLWEKFATQTFCIRFNF